jgi:alkylated DNA repair dioxygenase AlkB
VEAIENAIIPSTATTAATRMLIDDADGLAQVPYEAEFFSRAEADSLFDALMAETAWQTETIKRWNREIVTPRRVFTYSDPGVVYKYISLSRPGAPWTPAMLQIKARVEDYCKTTFNFCFANLYRDGQDAIGKHSDDEKALIPGHMIAAVSLSPSGGERDIVFTNKATKQRTSTRLAHGSLYVMQGATQQRYKHAIPRRAHVTQPRINLTFRQIRPVAAALSLSGKRVRANDDEQERVPKRVRLESAPVVRPASAEASSYELDFFADDASDAVAATEGV